MIKEYKKYIEDLEKKIDYLEKLDRKYFLEVIKLNGKIINYETNYIEYSKYEELQNDYINVVQILNNKNRGVK
jgi:hypothetical protein|tara:strand:+ start:199 stop:417 length:219 start_codon:yes stop_codon:yes gene_type:complete